MNRTLPVLRLAGAPVGLLLFFVGVWGFAVRRDFWDVSTFVLLLYGGTLGSVAGLFAAWKLRNRRLRGGWHEVVGSVAVVAVLAHVVVFALILSRPLRAGVNALAERVILAGMARELPEPPPPAASNPAP